MSKIESGKMILNIEQISLKDIMQGIVNIVQYPKNTRSSAPRTSRQLLKADTFH